MCCTLRRGALVCLGYGYWTTLFQTAICPHAKAQRDIYHGAGAPLFMKTLLLTLLLLPTSFLLSQDAPQHDYYSIRKAVDSLAHDYYFAKKNIQSAGMDYVSGTYFVAGGTGVMAVGTILAILSYRIKNAGEAKNARIAGYTLMGIGGAISITGFGFIINGHHKMAGLRAVRRDL